MIPQKPLAVGAALALLAPGLAAQTPPPAPEPPQPVAAADAIVPEEAVPSPIYSRYYVPFLDSIWSRLHYTQPFLRTDPLFPRFDTASGLEKPAQTSRVASRGFRAEVYAPIIEAKVGDIVEVPISIRNSPPWTAVRFFIEYDPKIVRPMAALGVGIPTEEMGFNAEPDPKEIPNADITFAAVNILAYPWAKEGPAMRLTFRAIREGESPLRASISEISDATFNLVPNVFRSGMIQVKPRQ